MKLYGKIYMYFVSQDVNLPQVNSRVYVAIGFALANSIMIIGDNGVVIVDVTESLEAAAEIYEAFRTITTKPITDIIYTHNHADHVNGAQVFYIKYTIKSIYLS